MGKILREYIEDMRKECEESGLLYAPNSVYHLCPIIGNRLNLSKEAVLTAEVAALTDFIDFLFEHSEHCDHITQREAWNEFREFEYKEIMKKESEKEKQLTLN